MSTGAHRRRAGLGAAAVFLALFWWASEGRREGVERYRWSSTMGELTQKPIVNETLVDGERGWRVDVMYAYAVDGREYMSSSVWGGLRHARGSEAEARRVESVLEGADSVRVFYDPRNPGRAALFRWRSSGPPMPIGVLAVLAAGFFGSLVWAFRGGRAGAA
jgi:Protein of unknown function (DUF3592)